MSKSHSVEACCQPDGWEGKAEYAKLLESATLPRTLAGLPDAVVESFKVLMKVRNPFSPCRRKMGGGRIKTFCVP